MTNEEKLHLTVRQIELAKQGKTEEADKIRRQIPMPPYLAKFAKDHFGLDFLKQNGWNLSEAEAAYGQTWANQ
jgi:hypothetical protein